MKEAWRRSSIRWEDDAAKQCCDPPIGAAEGSNPCPVGEVRFRRGDGLKRHRGDGPKRRRLERGHRRISRDDDDCKWNWGRTQVRRDPTSAYASFAATSTLSFSLTSTSTLTPNHPNFKPFIFKYIHHFFTRLHRN